MSRARRSAGEGSIYQEPNGRWVGLLELPRQPDGKRRRIKRRGRTRAEAVGKIRKVREQYEQLGEVGTANRLVTDTLDDYVSQVREAKRRSSAEVARDELFHRVLVAYLGRRRTSELSVHDCDAFLAAFIAGELTRSGRPLSRDYTNRARSFLSNALRNDMRQGYLVRNVADVALIPSTTARSKVKRALTIEEWRQLYEVATGAIRAGVDLGGRHGLRPQETRAVLWSDLDWTRGTLSIINQRDADDELVDPKTVGSTRTIRLHGQAIELLNRQRSAQQQQAERHGWSWSDESAVVATRHGTTMRQENYLTSLGVACRRAGIDPITPYELRHTAITHQIESGKTASQVADWAGTSELMIYRHYRHKLREVVDIDPLDYESGGSYSCDPS
ncbi:MAG: tyrosine-type recombinase/integrase [Actinomycetota bacterium]